MDTKICCCTVIIVVRVAITIVRRIRCARLSSDYPSPKQLSTWNVLYLLVIAGNEVRGDENEGMASCLPIFVPFTSSFLARQVSSSYRYLSLVSIRTTRGNLGRAWVLRGACRWNWFKEKVSRLRVGYVSRHERGLPWVLESCREYLHLCVYPPLSTRWLNAWARWVVLSKYVGTCSIVWIFGFGGRWILESITPKLVYSSRFITLENCWGRLIEIRYKKKMIVLVCKIG